MPGIQTNFGNCRVIDRSSRVSFALFYISIALAACGVTTGWAQGGLADTRVDDATFEALMKRMQPPGIPDSIVKPIQTAAELKEWGKVRSLSEELIRKPISEFPNAFYAYRLKASAHYFKYRVILETDGSYVAAFREQVAAIRDGSSSAAEEFSRGYLQGDDPRIRDAARMLSEKELEEILRTGAELGDEFAEAALGIANIVGTVPEDERLYWALLTIVRDKTRSTERRRALLEQISRKLGDTAVDAILRTYSSVGGPIPSSPLGLPARSAIETLFIEGDLRGTAGRTMATIVPPGLKTPEAPTVREQFDFYSRIFPEVGFGDAYMLVPGSRSSGQRRIIYADTSKILEELMPGDRVFVSCGPFSHVTIIYRRDPGSKTIMFLDPLYEYWDPAINSCVTKFDLVPGQNNRYLSAISEDDIGSMLQAVITFRNAQ